MKVDTSRIEKLPGISWALAHPRLAAWTVLSVGMIVLLVVEARDVGLLATQWAALMVACVLVAGLCVWIISWEDSDEEAATGEAAAPSEATNEVAAPHEATNEAATNEAGDKPAEAAPASTDAPSDAAPSADSPQE